MLRRGTATVALGLGQTTKRGATLIEDPAPQHKLKVFPLLI
jgi:hypothetical protein